jgi:hypothetical protein
MTLKTQSPPVRTPVRPPPVRADHTVRVVDIRNDHKTDGLLMGRGGQLRAPMQSLSSTPGVLPSNGAKPTGKAFLVNGIMTDAKLHLSDMQHLANTGLEVVGIRNATEGFFPDLTQSVQDKLRFPSVENKATSTVTKLILEAVEKKEPLLLVGHSQGALIISAALRSAADSLGHLSAAEKQRALSSIRVETYGGAAATYVNGPKYEHFVNRRDLVPMLTGVGLPLSQPGDGAQVRYFSESNPATDLPRVAKGVFNWFARVVDRTVHGPQDVYFDERLK